jgi:predicted nucleic acid-binding protein
MQAILDNTVLTNFAWINRPDLLYQLWPGAVYTTPQVLAEYQIGVEQGLLSAKLWQELPVLQLTETEKQLADQLPGRLGLGERTCLAVARLRQGVLISDDLDARRMATRLSVHTTGTIGILVACVQKQILTKDIANALLFQMVSAGYHSPFESLDPLLDG